MRQISLSIMIILITVICLDAKADTRTVQETGSVSSPSSSAAIPLNIDAEVQRSLQAIKAFAGSLQADLMSAIAEGGPTQAISVCNIKAGLIARDVSEQQGVDIKRVSLRNRNPNNAPDEWQKVVLEDFAARKLKGEPIAELTFTDVAETGTGKQFRFVKAIPTGAICVKCHGVNIEPEVKDKLDQLYPDDKARGFLPGDIRGAFVVTRDFTP
jgi:hypothetical protein